jgi:hypothetical protein
MSDIILGWQVQFFHAFLPRAAEAKDPVGFFYNYYIFFIVAIFFPRLAAACREAGNPTTLNRNPKPVALFPAVNYSVKCFVNYCVWSEF